MKNRLHFVFKAACFLSILSIYSCDEEKPNQNEQDIVITAPEEIIKIDEAKTYYESYGERRVPLIQKYEDSINRLKKIQDNKASQEPFDVGRSVYYDYERIKHNLAYIEQEAKKANVEISTLRFYYSNYPDQTLFPGSKGSIIHPRQNSVLISPTYSDGKRDYLFYIGQGAKGQEAIPLTDNFEPFKQNGKQKTTSSTAKASFAPNFKKSILAPKPFQEKQSLTLNRGTGVPPPNNQ